MRQNRWFRKWDKTTDSENDTKQPILIETKPLISKMRQNRRFYMRQNEKNPPILNETKPDFENWDKTADFKWDKTADSKNETKQPILNETKPPNPKMTQNSRF